MSKKSLAKSYLPSEEESFMNDNQLEYFRKKLLDWKSEIMDGTQDTIKGMRNGTKIFLMLQIELPRRQIGH